MEHGGSLTLLLVFLGKLSADVCFQSYSPYLDKGLQPDVSPPHVDGQKVNYKCGYNREVPGYKKIQSTCLVNTYVISNLLETDNCFIWEI